MTAGPGSRRAVGLALGLSLAVFLLSGASGYFAVPDEWVLRYAGPSEELTGAGLLATFLQILARNAGAMLFLYAGVVSAGLLTLVPLSLLALYVGATMKVGVVTIGMGRLVTEVGAYALLEFAGLVVAAGAGLVPLVSALLSAGGAGSRSPGRAYLHALPLSLRVLSAAALLVLVAAGVESVLIESR